MHSTARPVVAVVDRWHGSDTGAGKSALYAALGQYCVLKFVKATIPRRCVVTNYVKAFSPSIAKWRERKRYLDEAVFKYPATFRSLTAVYNKAVKGVGAFDALLQIGSLFGPLEPANGAPCLSYSDSTVSAVERLCPCWMPSDFQNVRKAWYELESAFFQRMDACMFYTHWAADTLISDYGIRRDKVHVVGSALKMPEAYDLELSQRNKHDVLFVTTDFQLKGGDDVLEIMARVRETMPTASLTIVGNVPEYVRRLELGWVTLTGPLQRSELAEVYRRSSVLLHPAKYDACPSVILEAANFGVPTVASNICGIPDLVWDGETGVLVPRDDKEGFAHHVLRLLKSSELREQMGSDARSYVRGRFTPTAVAERIHAVIQASLRRRE